ncbi:MAG: hypothetical protein WDM79_01785 [Terricaulis sp.]
MTQYFYSPEELPPGFQFPTTFMEFVTLDQASTLYPWWFLCEDSNLADGWLRIVREWYPTRPLVPSAKFDISDDIACFDGSGVSDDPIVHYVHAFAEAPHEARGWVENFDRWLENAKEESRVYKLERGDGEG